MVEVMTDYKANTKAKQVCVEWIRCPRCSMVYGYEIMGGAKLRVGKLKIKYVHAECGECGAEIWWTSGHRHMRKATERSKG